MLNLSFGNAYRDSKLHTAWSLCECAVGLCGRNSGHSRLLSRDN